jgi:hypothetical protein
LTTTTLAALIAGSQLLPVTARADEPPPPELHNVTYQARIDGVSRGAMVTYAAKDNQTQTADPTMLPGRVFEANTVLPANGHATIRVSIEWPYSANLHCEISVDDAVVSQADDFIAPRALPVRDDPDYGALTCEAPVGGVPNSAPGGDASPADTVAAPAE